MRAPYYQIITVSSRYIPDLAPIIVVEEPITEHADLLGSQRRDRDQTAITTIALANSCAPQHALNRSTPLLIKAKAELDAFFNGALQQFTLPLMLKGTEFQRSVWSALFSLRYGAMISYSEMATQIGHANACRAVGMAARRNPMLFALPCHRVCAKNGALSGYVAGLALKQQLLLMEKQCAA